ncbi:uncharacterized protein zgc:194621 [Carcharodon carcharias]|uniref:uncharacterized protein zgc:194621 n=1 Tax=Carcharodon carcharias TaxID=13397 RepID=UPI001B7E7D89|nr:uncharacterized protein zgc:194621 [Carcharodon carcharias]
MPYSVVRKPRIIHAGPQPATTRGILWGGDHDESGAMGKDGLGGQRVPVKGMGKGPGVGKGTNTGKATTISADKNIGESKVISTGKDTAGVGKGCTTVSRRYVATHQKSTPQKSAQKTIHSYGAYSVTVPDKKKWSDLQKKADAELAALDKLKRRNNGHVSITPSTVGGTLTQEEVRRRQQQDFNKAKMAQPELSGQQSPKNET